jgi:hypothetical protein
VQFYAGICTGYGQMDESVAFVSRKAIITDRKRAFFSPAGIGRFVTRKSHRHFFQSAFWRVPCQISVTSSTRLITGN